MALVRWEPFREVESLQRQLNYLFDEIAPTGRRGEEGIAFIPSAEIEETADGVHLKVEVPGTDPKDLDVQVSPEAVSISGERKSEIKTEERGITRTEFRYGRFQRVIPLPTRVQHDQVQAEYKDGILKLRLPKAEEDRNKVVKVTLGDGHRGNE